MKVPQGAHDLIMTKDEGNIRLALQLLKSKRKLAPFERYIGLKGKALVKFLQGDYFFVGHTHDFLRRDLNGSEFFKVVSFIGLYHISSLKHFLNCPQLESLDIECNNIGSLEGLEDCLNLKYLNMNCTPIASLLPLQNCTKLEYLDCFGKNITSFAGLENCIKLKMISLRDPAVPAEEIKRLKAILPNCKIYYKDR